MVKLAINFVCNGSGAFEILVYQWSRLRLGPTPYDINQQNSSNHPRQSFINQDYQWCTGKEGVCV